MIINKKLLYCGILLIIFSIALVIPFPNTHPYVLIEFSSIPLKTVNGYDLKGWASLILLFAGLIFTLKAIEKFRVWLVFFVLISFEVLPNLLVFTYQETVAKGVDAVSYERQESRCSFNKTAEEIMEAYCEFPLKNHSSEDVAFSLELFEYNLQEYSFRRHPLNLNLKGPFSVKLKGKEEKVFKIKTKIPLSEIITDFDGGEFSILNISISSEDKKRNL